MKPLFVMLVAFLSVSVIACGGTSRRIAPGGGRATAASETPPSSYAKVDADKDNDIGVPGDDTNNNDILNYAQPASPSEKRAITALLSSYYSVARDEDGSKACSMIYSTLAESIPEDYGMAPGPAYLRGAKTCPAVMTLLFKHFHAQLEAEVPVLKVARVRLQEHHGVAVLSFGKMPERQISIAREGPHAWKVETLLDSELH